MARDKCKTEYEINNLTREVALTLARSNNEELTVTIISAQYGLPATKVKNLIKRANEYLLSFSDFDPNVEFGKSILQFDEVYRLATETGNATAALSAVREMASLRNLYALTNGKISDDQKNFETENITRRHLENIGITETGLPLEELARRVSIYVINKIKQKV